jgi:4-amino-4-deoxy-L-arabinose transferase-like glycosyltransferase
MAILVLGCVLLFTGLGARSLWYLEGRWAEITRQMFLTGDFFHPMIGDEPYFDKPLITYWLVAVVTTLSGRLDEWTVRIPSAVSGLVAVLSTMWIGRQLWSARVGRYAGAILLTSYGLLFWSRTANADLENLAAITLAIGWYWAKRDRPGFGSFLVFYLIIFLGALTKGLPAVVIPVLAVLTDVAASRRWRTVLTPAHLLAAIIGLAIYIAPFWYASHTSPDNYHASGLALVFRENIVRFVQPFDHKGPIYLYFYYLPALLMPWAPLLVAAVIGLLKIRKDLDTRTRWLLYATGVIFAFFTASGSRRGYYILPLLPFCALMIGVFAVHVSDARIRVVRRTGIIAQGILLAIIVALKLLAPAVRKTLESQLGFALPRQLYVAMLVLGTASAVAGLAFWRFRFRSDAQDRRHLRAMVATATVLMGGFFCWQQNIVEVFRTERPFAQQLSQQIAGIPAQRVGFYRTGSANMLFYTGSEEPLAMLRSSRQLREFAGQSGKRILVTQRQFMADARRVWTERLLRPPDLAEQAQPWLEEPPGKHWVAWVIRADEAGPVSMSQTAEKTDEK